MGWVALVLYPTYTYLRLATQGESLLNPFYSVLIFWSFLHGSRGRKRFRFLSILSLDLAGMGTGWFINI